MTSDAFRDETPKPVAPTQRQMEHKASACRASALVLTLEGLPDQAAPYLSQAASLEGQLGRLRRLPGPALAPEGAR